METMLSNVSSPMTIYGYVAQWLFLPCVFLVSAMLPPKALAAGEVVEAPSTFSYAGGSAPEWATAAGPAPDNGNYQVTWKYPVFYGKDQLRLRKLNEWIRTISLTHLFTDDQQASGRAMTMKDSRVLAALDSDLDFRSAAGTQSELVPSRVFGPYIFFELYTEWLGAYRPQHGVQTLTFDYASGNPVPIESMFKAGAKEKLAALLEAAVEKTFNDDKRAYASCLSKKSRDPKQVCEPPLNENDMAACINWRSFDWHLVSIESARQVSLAFPFNPAWRQTCGEEYYILKGRSVESLLLAPNNFRRSHALEERKPQHPQHFTP